MSLAVAMLTLSVGGKPLAYDIPMPIAMKSPMPCAIVEEAISASVVLRLGSGAVREEEAGAWPVLFAKET